MKNYLFIFVMALLLSGCGGGGGGAAAPSSYTVGGAVSGLTGTVVLTDNGGDDLTITANGNFTFATRVSNNETYNVQVKTQPAGQTCSAGNNTGTILGANITAVAITCATNTYSVGGTVTGLNGTVVLTNNGGDDLTVAANGSFTFATEVAVNGAYNVQVKTQPAGQTCSAGNNTGTILGANIAAVTITCATNTYSVGGSVSGLNGTVILTNNGGGDIAVAANGSFSFATQVAYGGNYNVQVKTQPAGQTCSAGNNTGTILGANITAVAITCATNTHAVGGTVSGLSGTVILTNNGGGDLAVAANGSFSFATQVAYGGSYNVQVKTQPAGQTCSAGNNTGTMADANITTVAITCATNTYSVGGTVSGLSGTVILTNNGGGDLAVSANGSFTFAAPVAYGSNYNVQVKTQPAEQTCTPANNTGTMAGANVTNVTLACSVNTYPVGGTVSGLKGSLVLTNNSGDDILVNANGSYSFATQLVNGGTYGVAIKSMPSNQNCASSNGSGTITSAAVTNVDVSCESFLVVVAGGDHTLAIKPDGSLWSWGRNGNYQLGLGDKADRATPTQIGSDSNWMSVGVGQFHSLAIKTDGTLWAWGNNGGKLGLGDTADRATPTQVGTDTDWAAVSGGNSHTVALKTDGTLWAWGSNSYGQLGLGDTTQRTSPVQVGTDTDWATAAAGQYHSVAIKTNGTLWASGQNLYGELGQGDTTQRNALVQVGTGTDWSAVAANQSYSLAIKTSGTIWAWGLNNYGQLGQGNTTNRTSPVQVGSDTDWAAVSAGNAHVLAIKTTGTLWAWGANSSGQLGLGDLTQRTSPVQVGTDTDWAGISAGYAHAAGRKTDNTMLLWGNNAYGQLAQDTFGYIITPTQTIAGATWTAAATGAYHSMALKTDGTLWAWGYNAFGQLGQGNGTSSTTPVQVGTDTDWATVSSGQYHNLATKTTDSTLWAWGYNGYGQLGLGDTSNRNVPVQVGTDTDWAMVVSGPHFTMAIKTDGTLWAWGNNDYGQLGLGDTTHRNAPVQVGTDTNWASVAAGSVHTVAIKTNGTLWAWGENIYGKLGLGDTTNRSVPVQVGTDTDWVKAAAGTSHTVAIKTDGSLWSWGRNVFGQLGLGTTVDSSIPVHVGSDTDWAGVTAGDYSVAAIKTGGSLWAWGINGNGQLGQGDTTNRNVPTQIGSDTDWTAISKNVATANHNIGIKSDGSMLVWGNNGNDQLGVHTSSYTSPQAVAGW